VKPKPPKRGISVNEVGNRDEDQPVAGLPPTAPALADSYVETFHWTVDLSPEALWSVLGDPGRLDEAAGWPRVRLRSRKPRRARRINSPRGPFGWPFAMSFDEQPIEWVRPKWWRRERTYGSGPLASDVLTLAILRNHESVTTISFTVEVVPRGIVGWLLVRTALFRMARETFAQVLGDAMSQRHMRQSPDRVLSDVTIPDHLEDAVTRLDASPYGHDGTALIRWLLAAPGEDVVRIRPFELASDRRLSATAAIDTCLQAAAYGLMRPNWELVCNACGMLVQTEPRLGDLPGSAACPSCQTTVFRDLAQTVELTFAATDAVRQLDNADIDRAARRESYAAELRVGVDAGRARTVHATLAPGSYRVEALETGDGGEMTVSGGRFAAVTVGSGLSIGSGTEAGTLQVTNRGGERQTVVVSRLPRSDMGLRANRAITQQAFTELHAQDGLDEGESYSLGPVTVATFNLALEAASYQSGSSSGSYKQLRALIDQIKAAVAEAGGSTWGESEDAAVAVFAQSDAAARTVLHLRRLSESGRPIAATLLSGLASLVAKGEKRRVEGPALDGAQALHRLARRGDFLTDLTIAGDPTFQRLLQGAGLTGVRRDSTALPDGAYEEIIAAPDRQGRVA